MDAINLCNRNQTAKVLEKFYYNAVGRNYVSAIPDEAETILKLPTLEEIVYNENKTLSIIKKNI